MKAAAGFIILVVAFTVMSARAQPIAYPDLRDMRPRPEKPAMTAEELVKLGQDLSAARDRQQKPGGRPQPRSPQKGPPLKSKGTTDQN
jgi:hypothetical protein